MARGFENVCGIIKLQEIFITVTTVCHRYERLAILQNIFAIILLCARKDVE